MLCMHVRAVKYSTTRVIRECTAVQNVHTFFILCIYIYTYRAWQEHACMTSFVSVAANGAGVSTI